MNTTYDAVICGAGITGVSAAYFLNKAGIRNILLVDERPPLSFTSDRSTECYRNWWPDPEMLALMNRSIDLMESLADASGNVFRMNRRGYLYVTADENKIGAIKSASIRTSELGTGPIRIHTSEFSDYQPITPRQIDAFCHPAQQATQGFPSLAYHQSQQYGHKVLPLAFAEAQSKTIQVVAQGLR